MVITSSKVFWLLLVFTISVHFSEAQCSLSIRGTVIDLDTKEPLPYSNIVITELQKGGSTDERGAFVLENICPGSYTILVSHLSCESKEIKVVMTENKILYVELPHSHNLLKEVCITEEKPGMVATQAVSVISGQELAKSSGESLGETLEQVAGVTTLKTGSSISKPVIHGMHSNRVLILNNGIRQEGQQWGSEHAPEIDPFIAKKLTVIKGANTVRYGSDAIAGVILVEPDQLPSSPGITGELNLVGFSNNREGAASGIVEQNFNKLSPLSWRLQGTIKKGGNVKTPDYYLKNTGFEEFNFSYGLGWNKPRYGAELYYSQFNSNIGIFSGSHIGNLTDLEAAFTRPEPLETAEFTYDIERPYQHTEHELFKAKTWFLTGDAGKFSVTYARQYNLRNEYDKHRPLNDSLAMLDEPELTYTITSQSVDVIWEHNNILGLNGIIGASGLYQGNTFDGRMFIPNYINQTAGIFIIENWNRNKWQVEAGVRYDFRNLAVYIRDKELVNEEKYEYGNLNGTLGAAYDFTDHARLSLNAGTAWRPPGVNELYSDGLHHGAAAIEIGDPNLVPEKSINLIAALNIHDHKIYNIDVSLYYDRISDFIYLDPVVPPTLTIRGAFPTYKYKQADAKFSGLDFMGSVKLINHLEFSSKISIVRAFNTDANDYLVQTPADRYDLGITYKHPGNKKWKGNYAGIRFQYVAKQWRVPDEEDYLAPPDAYFLVNLEAGTIMNLGNQIVEVNAGVTNLFNVKYRDYMNRFRYFADDVGRNIFLKIKVPLNFKSKTN